MKKILIFVYTLLLSFFLFNHINVAYSAPIFSSNQEILIKLTFNGHQARAILVDHPTTQSLLKQLPVTLSFEDYAGTEKITYLPHKPTTKVSSGHHPKTGDIACYAPWGNLAFYYKDGTASSSLIYMGKFLSGLDAFARQGSKFNVTIERAE